MNTEKQELNGVKAALGVEMPQEFEQETRQKFLAQWFATDAAKRIGVDYRKRAAFAKEAGLTPAEIKAWRKALDE